MGAKGATPTSFGQKGGNRRNTTKPGSGRPPKIYSERMRLAAEAARIEAILADPDHPQFMKALQFAADRGMGKVSDVVEHTGNVQHAMTVRLVSSKGE
jgi:hypothetical protein